MTKLGQASAAPSHSAGFTLLEMLLVVLIVGIMGVAGSNLINSQSIERVIMSHAQQFSANLKFICEKAVFENQAFGIEWQPNGYQVLRYQQPNWLVVEQQQATQFPDGIASEIRLDGYPQILADEADDLPHIICQADGSFNAFEVRFVANNGQTNKQAYYALSNTTPWQVTGGWHQP